jgi:hypothetical protein
MESGTIAVSARPPRVKIPLNKISPTPAQSISHRISDRLIPVAIRPNPTFLRALRHHQRGHTIQSSHRHQKSRESKESQLGSLEPGTIRQFAYGSFNVPMSTGTVGSRPERRCARRPGPYRGPKRVEKCSHCKETGRLAVLAALPEEQDAGEFSRSAVSEIEFWLAEVLPLVEKLSN